MNSSQRKRRRARREQARINKKRTELYGCLDFDHITDPATLSKSALSCEVGVAWKRSVQSFMLTRMENCIELSEKLRDGSYKKKPANHFTLHERGKKRLISAVNFRDRVVQKAYCENFLIPVLCYGVVYDNSASQTGKGTDFARDRFDLHMRRALVRYGSDGWFVHFDFKDYFASINPEMAMKMIEERAMPLVETAQDAENLRKLLNLGRVFICEEEGLGLGNQTSQTVALAYADPIDHAIREICCCGLSGRYMDDGYVFCKSKDQAYQVLGVAEQHANRLGLKLHSRKSGVEPILHRHTFLKTVYSVRSDGSINREVSRDTIRRYKRHYKSIANLVRKGRIPADVLDASEGAWKGVALRASDPEKYLREMQCFFEETKSQMLSNVSRG